MVYHTPEFREDRKYYVNRENLDELENKIKEALKS